MTNNPNRLGIIITVITVIFFISLTPFLSDYQTLKQNSDLTSHLAVNTHPIQDMNADVTITHCVQLSNGEVNCK